MREEWVGSMKEVNMPKKLREENNVRNKRNES